MGTNDETEKPGQHSDQHVIEDRVRERERVLTERAAHFDAMGDKREGFREQTIETLRAIARVYRDSTPAADDENVRTHLRELFETKGREVDEGMIDEALEGA